MNAASLAEGEVFLRLAMALAIGLLVGVERGWRERNATAGSRTAGIRTYGLTGILGGVTAVVSEAMQSPWPFAAAFIAFTIVFGAFKLEEARQDRDNSVTGVVAGLVVFALGGLAVAGDLTLAAASGVATAALLASREALHGWLRRLTWAELSSALLLLAMTTIVLPLLPDRPIDPFGSVNLRQIWLFTILTAALSFAGYVAVKALGETHGRVATGVLGGMVSASIVTVTMARQVRQSAAPQSAGALAGVALLASMASVARVLTLTAAVDPGFGLRLLPPVGAAALVFGIWGGALVAWSADGKTDAATALANPFELKLVLGIGLLMVVVSFLLGWLTSQFTPESIYGLAVFAGLADVDTFAISTARLRGPSITEQIAIGAILIAILANALQRAAYAILLGGPRFGLHFTAGTLAAAVAGAAGFLLS